jgi:predicted RNase H-like nuclease (RuvC/YqgF family)
MTADEVMRLAYDARYTYDWDSLESAIRSLITENERLAGEVKDRQDYIQTLTDASQKWLKECDSLKAELAELKAIEEKRNTCVVCSAVLLRQEEIPHCEDCIVMDEGGLE